MIRNTYPDNIDVAAIYISIGKCGDTGKFFESCPCQKCAAMYEEAYAMNTEFDGDAQEEADRLDTIGYMRNGF